VQILIAEDDLISRRALEATLVKWGYQVRAVEDGGAAWRILQEPGAPKMAILDWMMPELDGVEVCRRARAQAQSEAAYLILLTAKSNKDELIEGLRGGADDYLTKPFNRDELMARVQVGWRVINLQTRLADRVRELEAALSRVKQLQGLLPICSYCKKIRNDQNYWQQIDAYFADHSEAQFSHGICPSCYENVVQPELRKHLTQGSSQSVDHG
jgi:sigma-B regulation protein RsbU (phosphoserine phosphatase)